MQQAARVSDYTGFFNIEGTGKPGRLIEMDDTKTIFSQPKEKATEDYVSGRFGQCGVQSRPTQHAQRPPIVRTRSPPPRAVSATSSLAVSGLGCQAPSGRLRTR